MWGLFRCEDMDATAKNQFLWSILPGFCYVFYMVMGFSHIPRKKPYNKLFKLKTYGIHLFGSVVSSLLGVYLCQHNMPATGLFSPFVFLLTLLLADKTVQILAGRHILIAMRGDKKPASYKWYLDGFLGFLVLFFPLISAGIALNWVRFGKWIT